MTEEDSSVPRRPVRRGEGEVTEWPRGLLEYVPKGPPDSAPPPEEDRTRNRLRLAARLLGLLRSRGEDVDRELATLAEAERALRANDAARATREVEALLAELDRRTRSAPSSGTTA